MPMQNISRLWYSSNVRTNFYQACLVIGIVAASAWVIDTSSTNLDKLGIKTGLDFLDTEAGFAISQSLIPFSDTSTYAEALIVCILNTVVLSLAAIILSTFLGFFVALSRLSSNWLLNKISNIYVEIFRNVPLLLQLFFWYFAVLKLLPDKRQSVSFFDIAFLNIEGLVVPSPIFGDGAYYVVCSIFVAILLVVLLYYWAKKRQENTGNTLPVFRWGLLILFLLPFIVAWLTSFPISWKIPVFGRFNFQGGTELLPEFVAMLFGLTLYNAAFIGEIIRAGIMSVNKGQREAAASIGLSPSQIYNEVIVPQALRLIIPPLTNQYLNLTKSTALASAIAYPDLFWAVNGAILVQTGQVLELQALTLGAYLGLSLIIALTMNTFNQVTRIKER
jgi:general L-amino acid transport system permease protein|tara:strand:- start:297 stop:1466 length:1170 start_codon:yes stop_codon:yes gene_type:complete